MTETLRDKIARAMRDNLAEQALAGGAGDFAFQAIGATIQTAMPFDLYPLTDAALTALAVAGPTDEMVEAGARAIATSYGLDPDDIAPRSVICGPGNEHLQEWEAYTEQARACFTAMLAAQGEGK